MKFKKISIRRIVLLSALMVFTNLFAGLAAAQKEAPSLLVVVKDENAMQITDPAAKTVLATVPVGEGPHEVEASSDGKLAFVSNYGLQNGAVNPGRSISVIDLAGRKELRRINIGPSSRPHGLVFAGGRLYFTAEGYKLIGCYDPASNQIDWLLGIGQNRTHLVVLTKDMNTMFTSNIQSDSVTMLEKAPFPLDWKETVIPVGKGPEAIDVSPDGREVWTATGGDGSVSIIDVAGKKVKQTLNLQMARSNRLKFTLDGRRVLITDSRGGRLLVLDAAERKELKRMDIGRAPEGILMAPDGALAYVAVSGENNIAILDLKTMEVVGRILTGKAPDGLAWAAAR